jgi:hypothetical protein
MAKLVGGDLDIDYSQLIGRFFGCQFVMYYADKNAGIYEVKIPWSRHKYENEGLLTLMLRIIVCLDVDLQIRWADVWLS